ncbi:hypothetical protein AB6A23_21955 [Paenibacillus tarimensis]
MRKILYIFLPLLLVVLIAAVYLVQKSQVIKAEMVWGSGRDADRHYILNKEFEEIKSNAEQINMMKDSTYVNINYVVIYEENKWFQNQKKALKLIRFERPLPEVKLKSADTMYYKLVDESVHDVNEKHSVFIRLYEKYENNHNLFGLEPLPIVIPRVNSVQEARTWIQANEPGFMKLLPSTVVETDLLNEWTNDHYEPATEYSTQSPEDLTVQKIVENGK